MCYDREGSVADEYFALYISQWGRDGDLVLLIYNPSRFPA